MAQSRPIHTFDTPNESDALLQNMTFIATQTQESDEAEPVSTLEETAVQYLKLVSKRSNLLSIEEEVELAKRIEKGDTQAKRKLAQANLRLVISIAKRYAGRGASFMDLVQEGNLGLMKAIDKFNYRLGYKFSTYASCWIKQSVFQAFAEHDRPIRLPGHVMDSVFKLRKARHVLQERYERPATDSELAIHMGVSLKKLQRIAQAAQSTVSLEMENQHKDGNIQTLGDTLEDERFRDHDLALHKARSLQALRIALSCHLEPKERDILLKRYGFSSDSTNAGSEQKNKMTLEEIGKLYGVTRECIRQTEIRAIQKLRQSSLIQQLLD